MLGVEDVQSLIDKSRSCSMMNIHAPRPCHGPVQTFEKHIQNRTSRCAFRLDPWKHHQTSLGGKILSPDERIFVLSGRAGQGKSTVLRHLFVHLLSNKKVLTRESVRILEHNSMQTFHNFQGLSRHCTLHQARELSEHVEFQRNLSQLIFIDGLDEANEITKLKPWLNSWLTTPPPSSSFPVGPSSTRLVICTKKKSFNLKNSRINCKEELLRQPFAESVYLEDLTHKEKKDLLSLIAQVDPKQAGKASTCIPWLRTIHPFFSVRLIFGVQGKNPKTKSEFFIEHLKWLVEWWVKTTSEENSSNLWPSLERLNSSTETLQKKAGWSSHGNLTMLPFTPCVCSISLNPRWCTTTSIWQHRRKRLASSLVFWHSIICWTDCESGSAQFRANGGFIRQFKPFFSMWKDVISVTWFSSMNPAYVLLGYIVNNLFADNLFEALRWWFWRFYTSSIVDSSSNVDGWCCSSGWWVETRIFSWANSLALASCCAECDCNEKASPAVFAKKFDVGKHQT